MVGPECDFFCGFNIKFVSRKCNAGGAGTENTPFCNLQKIKAAQVLKNYLQGMLEDSYLVWFGFRSGVGFFVFTGISMDLGQKGLKYN